MPQSGFTGISYPFRVNSRGGISMSTTSATDPSHIAESIAQIFGTSYLERPMESDIYTTVTPMLFEVNDIALQQVLKNRMVNDLARLEPRVSLTEEDIEFEVETEEGIVSLYATIHFKVILYNTAYTTKVRLGEISNE